MVPETIFESRDLTPSAKNRDVRALSSVWIECLASDQAVAGSNPAAPILLYHNSGSHDCRGFYIKEPRKHGLDSNPSRVGGVFVVCHSIGYQIEGMLTLCVTFSLVRRVQVQLLEHCALLNPMTAWGSLFESLFEVVDCGGQHELAEFAVPCARGGTAGPTLDGRKGSLGHPALAV